MRSTGNGLQKFRHANSCEPTYPRGPDKDELIGRIVEVTGYGETNDITEVVVTLLELN